uniref:t-SNARE coiled-coil homology domain-containing protein n=1 Tax=Gossypium raimondii TaxID=29730 RepID=A0A0D2QQS8_GOSRA|nr:hypothetical protein B456_003G095600 [Gossypium raimondii]
MAKSSKLASSDVELYNGSSSSKDERMNAQVNGEEDDEEEIEAVARSVDTFDEDDDIVPEEIVDDVDDDEYNGANPEISKREKERLKEMQKLKKQKIQEILDTQNAAIDADMVRILGKMELASKEKSKASAVAVNAEIRRTKARLLEEVPKLQRLAVKKVKGISTEEMAARNDQMSSSPSTSSTAIKFDSDERFDNKYFQEFEQSSQFRQDYEMRKMKQAYQGLDMISEVLDTLKNMAHDMNEELDRQVPLMDEINTKVDKAAADFKNTNVRLKDTVTQLRSSRNFCIDIVLLCIVLGIAAYLYK